MSETGNTSLPFFPGDGDGAPPEGSRFGRAHHVLLAFVALAVVAWLLSGIYQVNADEVAVVERLGQYQTTSEGKIFLMEHGLHYHIPWPIDRVQKIAVQQMKLLTVKTFNESPDSNAAFKLQLQKEYVPADVISALFDPYLITGDRNMVHMEIAVSYQISDPEAWLTTVAHTEEANSHSTGNREEVIQRLVEHALIGQIATVPVDNILFQDRDKLRGQLFNAITDSVVLPDPEDPTGKKKLEIGIKVQKVDIVEARPPAVVKESFDQVFKARQDLQTTTLKAEAAEKAAITAAHAQEENLITRAKAYASQTVDTAKGEASRFSQIYEQYKAAPDVTRWNVYVAAVKSLSSTASRLVFGQAGQPVWIPISPPQFDEQKVQPQR